VDPVQYHAQVSHWIWVDPAHEVVTPTLELSFGLITIGLPDDSREADGRAAERRLRELRTRVKAARAAISATPRAEEVLQRDWVKAARAVVSTTPGLAETLAGDWQKAARFCARFGVTETCFRNGIPSGGDYEGSKPGLYDIGSL
jgi:hypothetical protein